MFFLITIDQMMIECVKGKGSLVVTKCLSAYCFGFSSTQLFHFGSLALIVIFFGHNRQLFSAKKLKPRLYTTCPAPNGRQPK